MAEWKEWYGDGPMPASVRTYVEYQLRDGFRDICFAGDLEWEHDPDRPEDDIVVYRTLTKAEHDELYGSDTPVRDWIERYQFRIGMTAVSIVGIAVVIFAFGAVLK